MRKHTYTGHGGVALAANVGGDPGHPSVVLLHGGGQTRHSWAGAAAALVARGYHVVTFDARGHGESDWSPEGEYLIDHFAGDLQAIVRTLPTAPAIIGASLGGLTSLIAVGEAPVEFASALVLVDIVPQVKPEGVERIRSFMTAYPQGFANLDEAAEAVTAYLPHRARPRSNSGLQKNLRRGPDDRLRWHWDPRLMADETRSDVQRLQQRLELAATRVRVPTLVLRGEHSELVSPDGVEALLALIPGARAADVGGARHMIAGDKNDAFNAAVLGFLDGIR